MIAWIAIAVLVIGVLWLIMLYQDEINQYDDVDPLPEIKVRRRLELYDQDDHA